MRDCKQSRSFPSARCSMITFLVTRRASGTKSDCLLSTFEKIAVILLTLSVVQLMAKIYKHEMYFSISIKVRTLAPVPSLPIPKAL